MNKSLLPIRVYGLCIDKHGRLLVLNEFVAGESIFKFPGGGLESGESPLQCLQRELNEEIGLYIDDAELFFTPSEPVYNYFKPSEQVLPVYFKVHTNQEILSERIREKNIKEFIWHDSNAPNVEQLTFESDKKAAQLLIKEKSGHKLSE